MTIKKKESSDNTRKRKRIIPTRAAGTPAFENPADELFAEAFANRDSKKEELEHQEISLPSTNVSASRPQLSNITSASSSVDGLPFTDTSLPSTNQLK